MSELPQRVTPSPQVVFQELEGEAVLLDLGAERFFELNPVGTRIWQLFAEQPDVASVREQLLEEFDVEADTLNSDLSNLIARLSEAGLVSVE